MILTLTYDIDLQSPASYSHGLLTRKSFKVNGQSVRKTEWKQTDGRTEAMALLAR